MFLNFVECPDGLYGEMCQNKCGHYSNQSKCHHINGTCMNGCLPGYKSEFCNQCTLIHIAVVYVQRFTLLLYHIIRQVSNLIIECERPEYHFLSPLSRFKYVADLVKPP